MNRLGNQQGFNLIELMFAVVVLLVGVLGMVTMQQRGITYSQDAIMRNQAISLAKEYQQIMKTYPSQVAKQTNPVKDVRSDSVFLKAIGADFPNANGQGTCLLSPAANDMEALAMKARDCWKDKAYKILLGATNNDNDQFFLNNFFVCQSVDSSNCGTNANSAANDMVIIQVAWESKEELCFSKNITSGNARTSLCTYQLRGLPY